MVSAPTVSAGFSTNSALTPSPALTPHIPPAAALTVGHVGERLVAAWPSPVCVCSFAVNPCLVVAWGLRFPAVIGLALHDAAVCRCQASTAGLAWFIAHHVVCFYCAVASPVLSRCLRPDARRLRYPFAARGCFCWAVRVSSLFSAGFLYMVLISLRWWGRCVEPASRSLGRHRHEAVLTHVVVFGTVSRSFASLRPFGAFFIVFDLIVCAPSRACDKNGCSYALVLILAFVLSVRPVRQSGVSLTEVSACQ